MRPIIAGTILGFALGALLFVFVPRTTEFSLFERPGFRSELLGELVSALRNRTASSTTLFFVGDIMLGRAVEARIERDGFSYPFVSTADLISAHDLAIGNFEGVVTEVHTKAPSMTFRFSIKDEYLKQLGDVGFDVLSNANNHSLDYGVPALVYMRSRCTAYSITCVGSPLNYRPYTTKVIVVDNKRIGLIALHTLFVSPTDADIQSILAELVHESDIQIAYVHWGEEYVLTHNASQEHLAQTLIDNGVDVVVGHHPHVAQDIALYNGKPIFYSLGNFVFDQFFSNDVQEMYGVSMTIDDDTIVSTVIPFSSKETHSRPVLMLEYDAVPFIKRLFSGIASSTDVQTDTRTIRSPY